jgi:V/A-type H+-transporting ATPase subunit B
VFEEKFIGQDIQENRAIEKTLSLGWDILGLLPKNELDRVEPGMIAEYYKPKTEAEL